MIYDILKVLLSMAAIPFAVAAIALAAAVVICAVMAPFCLFTILCLYKFDWREASDMEWGTRLRKFGPLGRIK